MPNFMIGSDPEVFLKNASGKLISSIGKVGGTKAKPRPTLHGSVQEDNVLLEFNSVPAETREEFVTNHMAVMQDIHEIIKPLDLSISIQPTGVFDEDQLEDEQAKLAGCEPDYDAWHMCQNDPPDLSATNLRSGAGHLHISVDYLGDERCKFEAIRRAELVKACDIMCGIPSVLMDPDSTRRSLYGKAGCHRPKFKGTDDPFNGIEYRTLSNFWLQSEEYISWAYEAAAMAVNMSDELNDLLVEGTISGNEVQRIINESDVKAAEAFVKEYGLLVA